MKKLLLLALVIVAMTSCKKDKEQEELPVGVAVTAQYSIILETSDGLSLFAPSTPNYININDIRIKYLADDGVVKLYACDFPGVQADRPYGVEIDPKSIPTYDGNKSMAIIEIIAPVHKFGAMLEIPEGETYMLNYIHWSETMIDKVEIVMEKLMGNRTFGIWPKEIKINDKLVYTRTEENKSYPIIFVRTTDGAKSSYALKDIAWQ